MTDRSYNAVSSAEVMWQQMQCSILIMNDNQKSVETELHLDRSMIQKLS